MRTEMHPDAVRAHVAEWHRQGHSVALVPTMGNLHAGHYSLLERARECCDRVVASVFVNPAQFGPDEDYERYPRTPDRDRAGLAAHGCDLLFAPDAQAIYPWGVDASVTVHVPGLTEILEGAYRPGHFDGVTTVVSKLLVIVQPDVAVFGRKDYQQWRVIERMCRDLQFGVEIIAAPIVRDADGLALSSRNQYLTSSQRATAPGLQQALVQARALIGQGSDCEAVERQITQQLVAGGFVADYVAIRNATDLAMPAPDQRTGLVVLAAARLGTVRLIDNVEILQASD